MDVRDVLAIYAEVTPQLRGNFKQVFEKIPEQEFEAFAQGLGINEPQYKFLLAFLAKNWDILGSRSKGEIFTDLGEVLKTYLGKNDVTSLRNLSLQTLNQYKGVKKETASGEKGFRIVRIDDVETCVRLTADSGWCVKEDEYAIDYLDQGPLFLVVKDGKRLALIQPESGSYMDVYDNRLKPDALLYILNGVLGFPEGQDLLQRIGYSISQDEGNPSFSIGMVTLLLQNNYMSYEDVFMLLTGDDIRWLLNKDRFELIDFLLQGGIDLDDSVGGRPPILFTYVDSGIPTVVEGLLHRGLNPNIEYEFDDWIVSPLAKAMSESVDNSPSYMEIARLLLKYGANPNYLRGGYPILVDVVSDGKLNCVRLLLETGADPNAVDPNNQTPLHHLARSGKYFKNQHGLIMKLLLDAGAKTDVIDDNGLTPAQTAEKHQTPDFLDVLNQLRKPKAIV